MVFQDNRSKRNILNLEIIALDYIKFIYCHGMEKLREEY